MNLDLKNKVVLITGGAKGIGAAITRACTEEGAIPFVIDSDAAACEQMNENFKRDGIAGSTLEIDLSSAENCKEAAERAYSQFKRIDALVNNAGINDKVGLENGGPQQFIDSLQRNLLHYYNMAHYALRHLKSSCGSIVNISSKTAITGQGGTSGYACSKGGVLALTREWAVELLDAGIRVNAIVPAEVQTPAYDKWLATFPDSREKLKTILSKIPLQKRMTTPDEIAAMVLFLISARAGHITGQHLFVDGGYVHLDRALT